MKGRIQAMIVASTLALLSLKIPPISILSSATVALVTLRRGGSEGIYVLISSSVAAGVLGYAFIGNYQVGLLYGLVLWLPVWVISIVLREGRQLTLAVEIAVLVGIFGVIGFYLYVDDPSAIWQSILQQMVPDNVSVEDVQQRVDVLSHYMTGIVAAGTVFGLLFGLLLGRWWQAVLYNPGGFREEFLSLNTSPKLALVSIAVVVLAILGPVSLSEIAWNVTILLFVLYLFIGTAVLHTVFAVMKQGRYLVPMFYITLLLLPHALLPVALIGLSDAWLNIRKKNSNQTRA
ncbi:MAG: hypothetical protein ACU84H_09275 [Gammaproteobacteria bacterium]